MRAWWRFPVSWVFSLCEGMNANHHCCKDHRSGTPKGTKQLFLPQDLCFCFISTISSITHGIAGSTFFFFFFLKFEAPVLLAGGDTRSNMPDSYMKASLSFAGEKSKGWWDAAWENPHCSWANVTKVWEEGGKKSNYAVWNRIFTLNVPSPFLSDFSFAVSLSVPGEPQFLPQLLCLKVFVRNCVHRFLTFAILPLNASCEAATGEFSGRAKPDTAHNLQWMKFLRWCFLPDFHVLFFTSDQSGAADPALVPTVCGSSGDETQVHVEHFPVYWIRRRAGPDQGEGPVLWNLWREFFKRELKLLCLFQMFERGLKISLGKVQCEFVPPCDIMWGQPSQTGCFSTICEMWHFPYAFWRESVHPDIPITKHRSTFYF